MLAGSGSSGKPAAYHSIRTDSAKHTAWRGVAPLTSFSNNSTRLSAWAIFENKSLPTRVKFFKFTQQKSPNASRRGPARIYIWLRNSPQGSGTRWPLSPLQMAIIHPKLSYYLVSMIAICQSELSYQRCLSAA